MHPKNMLITHAYYLISEGIILYLLALPISFYYFREISWWRYFLIIVGIAFVFSICAKFFKSYTPYVALIPIITYVFILLGYPLFLSIAFAGIIAWRYIVIRARLYYNSETAYLSMSIFLTLLGILIVRDIQLVILPLVQIIVNMLGYTISNLVEIDREERKSFNRTMWLKWIGTFTVFTVVIYWLRDSLTLMANGLWNLVGDSLSFILTGIVNIFDFLPINNFVNNHSANEMQGVELVNQDEPFELPEEASSAGNLDFFMVIIICALIIMFILAIYRAMKAKVRERNITSPSNFNKTEEKLDLPGRRRQVLFRKKKVKIDHPVRKLMYQFEKRAAKLKMGRLSYESLEDWFQRLGFEENIDIYQKVRYGGQEITIKEQEEIKLTLKRLENRLSVLEEV